MPVMLRVGLCGFTMSMEDYPLYFPVVEVQQTFYEPPRDLTMKRWVEATPAGFEFTLKAWQLVTHPGTSPTYRRIKRAMSEADRAGAGFFQDTAIVHEGYRRSIECARVLRATGMLFQCPSSFAPEPQNVARMRSFFSRIERPPGLRFLWEPRGSRWVAAREEARGLARELDLVHVIDPFVTPPPSDRVRAPVYWRLHGIGGSRHSYTDGQLRQLKWMADEAAGGRTAWILFNNLPRVGDARRFLKLASVSES
ncbi:MAG TPA: DUF72 domain-containing protein [Thermoanaerobaculia bacterium]|nr:DUF72 domain-containing protein [Thermoanaerobaculia bacterium]